MSLDKKARGGIENMIIVNSVLEGDRPGVLIVFLFEGVEVPASL